MAGTGSGLGKVLVTDKPDKRKSKESLCEQSFIKFCLIHWYTRAP